MNSNIAIQIKNLSKQYRLGQVGTGTVSHDLKRWFAMNIRGKEDPYLKIGESNDRSTKGESDYVWALKGINIEIEQGDVVGIIGKNGAGKSTLLKILSRVTKPTIGYINYRGRIASLLEVGTGFHPEMTGRENIYMNGAIMGMTRREISIKLDEIVAFAGIERYLDTPVKRYSSGMTVRLGFAIAAHLEPDILVVDEVLAVGDAEFQKKAIGKMQDVSQKGGRTVLFVSHNMTSIQKLCNVGILLNQGAIAYKGSINDTINNYLSEGDCIQHTYSFQKPEIINKGYCYKIEIFDEYNNLLNEIPIGRNWYIKVYFEIADSYVDHFIVALGLSDKYEQPIRTFYSNYKRQEKGHYIATFKNDGIFLASGSYKINIGLSSYERTFHYINNPECRLVISNVTDLVESKNIVRTSEVGVILNPINIQITKNNV